MRIDRAAIPFVAGFLVPSLLFFALGLAAAGVVFLALTAFMVFFFRDPDRLAPASERAVIAPADGKVMTAGVADPASAPPGAWQQITIFLSPLDVHINRMPVSGTITRVDYVPGTFLPAYKPDSRLNERTELWIDHGGEAVVVRQVVGVLARRVVCRARPGDRVQAGQRFGLMKFGSRMDVFLPPSARLFVRSGERVRGGETVLAEL